MIALNRDPLYTAPVDTDVNGPDIDREISEHTRLIAAGYVSRGIRYLEIGRFNEAIADLTTAIELNPTEASAYEHRAKAHHELGDVRNREPDLRRANELRQRQNDPAPGSWNFAAGYELAVRRRDGSERFLKTYPLTNQNLDDAILDAGQVICQYEQSKSARPRGYRRSRSVVYESSWSEPSRNHSLFGEGCKPLRIRWLASSSLIRLSKSELDRLRTERLWVNSLCERYGRLQSLQNWSSDTKRTFTDHDSGVQELSQRPW